MTQRHGILALIGLFVSSAWVCAFAAENDSGAYHAAGPYAVGTVPSIALQDWSRATLVHTRVYYPQVEGEEQGEGQFPVIVFSHGLGANKDAFSSIGQHWASHGYVVLHPSHHDWGVSMGPDGLNPPPERILNRVRDVEAAMDLLDQLEVRVLELEGRIDRERIGVSGHSYGSFIAMLFGGVTATIGEEENRNLADSRVRCVAPIATAGRGDYGLNDHSWEQVQVPALYINGTADVRQGREQDWRLEPFEFSPPGSSWQLLIEEANHGSFGGGQAGGDAPHYVKAASAAFWDHCLRGSEDALAWLEGEEGFNAFAGGAAAVTAK